MVTHFCKRYEPVWELGSSRTVYVCFCGWTHRCMHCGDSQYEHGGNFTKCLWGPREYTQPPADAVVYPGIR